MQASDRPEQCNGEIAVWKQQCGPCCACSPRPAPILSVNFVVLKRQSTSGRGPWVGDFLERDRLMRLDRLMVMFCLPKALSLAGFHTDAAEQAGERIPMPCAGVFVHAYTLGRALERAYPAKRTLFRVVDQFAPTPFERRSLFRRVAPGGFTSHQVAQDIGGHLEHYAISFPLVFSRPAL